MYKVGGKKLETELQVTGQHNLQNAAAALALAQIVLPDVEPGKLIKQLATVGPAFGRGQRFKLKNGSELQLNLVKNPASFRQGLASYVKANTAIMIAINDRVADSRDMSWLWDVDFSSLKDHFVACVTGTRASDIALRLAYDDITVKEIEADSEKALRNFCAAPGDKVAFATYTAMLRLHTLLERKAGKDL